MGLHDSCLRFKRRASATAEHFWLPAADLPDADDASSASSSLRPRSLQPNCPDVHRGSRHPILQRLYKMFRRPPACIWVRNSADEDIIVVVSKFGPFRTLTGAEVSGSPAGGGLKFDIDSFAVGATKKTLRPEDPAGQAAATARFPLWSHFAKAAVVSIYRASDGTVCIENDQVPAGGLVIYSGEPNLKLYNFYGEHVDSGPPDINISPVMSRVVQPNQKQTHHSRDSSETVEKRLQSEDLVMVSPMKGSTGVPVFSMEQDMQGKARRSDTI